MIAAADWIADIGPSAGPAGGEVLFAGAPSAFVAEARADDTHARSATRAFLRGDRKLEVPDRRRTGTGELVLSGARRNNLRSVDATFLTGALNVVCGVSGAGKTSLVEELVDRISRRVVLPGADRIDKVIALDSSPIGRTPRSNPATYTGISDRIRDLFASLPEAKARGLGPSAFSFNVAGGRCPDCEGAGVKQLGMRFLGTVDLPCESCGGKRFLDAVLEVRFDGKSIRDVLDTTIHEARALFSAHPRILGTLALLDDLGLGYLPLGHPATALSGGEAQRIKLATELVGSKKARTLYVLDEPTIGMHPVDVERFLRAVHRLVDDGHTVIAVEHDLDFVRAADRVIELGPGSGSEGGTIVVAGTPEDLAACAQSATGRFLRAAPGTPSPVPREPPAVAAAAVRLRGVRTRNLRSIDVEFPSGARRADARQRRR
ncbi:MAG TPA: excinuclease ABC subunit UvrA, partial [Polyangiaceae bacterium]|nr:excinuclease ABC subunit UvrA [Polyangiaceae bacterium]